MAEEISLFTLIIVAMVRGSNFYEISPENREIGKCIYLKLNSKIVMIIMWIILGINGGGLLLWCIKNSIFVEWIWPTITKIFKKRPKTGEEELLINRPKVIDFE